MAFRPLRQRRKDRLLESGFLRFEAHELSKIPLNRPTMHKMMLDRRREVVSWRKQGLSDRRIIAKIAERYEENDWIIRRGSKGRRHLEGYPDPWGWQHSVRDELERQGIVDESKPSDRSHHIGESPELRREQKERELDRRKAARRRRAEAPTDKPVRYNSITRRWEEVS